MNGAERIEAVAYRAIAAASGAFVQDVRGGVCLASPHVPATEVNRVVGVEADLDLDAVEEFYARAGVRVVVPVPPGLDALEHELEGRRYARGYPWVKFEREAERAPTADSTLRIEETNDADAYGRTVAEGFGAPPESSGAFGGVVGLPGWHCFVAWDGNDPAAGAALLVDGGAAWLGAASTRPAFRRRGAQNALLAARIERAVELGAQLLTVETGAPAGGRPGGSYRNILRAGFRESYVRPNWLAPA